MICRCIDAMHFPRRGSGDCLEPFLASSLPVLLGIVLRESIDLTSSQGGEAAVAGSSSADKGNLRVRIEVKLHALQGGEEIPLRFKDAGDLGGLEIAKDERMKAGPLRFIEPFAGIGADMDGQEPAGLVADGKARSAIVGGEDVLLLEPGNKLGRIASPGCELPLLFWGKCGREILPGGGRRKGCRGRCSRSRRRELLIVTDAGQVKVSGNGFFCGETLELLEEGDLITFLFTSAGAIDPTPGAGPLENREGRGALPVAGAERGGHIAGAGLRRLKPQGSKKLGKREGGLCVQDRGSIVHSGK